LQLPSLLLLHTFYLLYIALLDLFHLALSFILFALFSLFLVYRFLSSKQEGNCAPQLLSKRNHDEKFRAFTSYFRVNRFSCKFKLYFLHFLISISPIHPQPLGDFRVLKVLHADSSCGPCGHVYCFSWS